MGYPRSMTDRFHATLCLRRLLLLLLVAAAYAATDIDFVKTSCSKTRYPVVCLDALSQAAPSIHSDPVLLASAALNATLSSVHTASSTLTTLLTANAGSAKQPGPLKDCLEELADAAGELKRSATVMAHLGGQQLGEQVDNMQTWVSAALTDADTCLEGFRGGGNIGGPRGGARGTGLEGEARGRVAEAGQMASNALYFINALVAPAQPQSQDELAAQD